MPRSPANRGKNRGGNPPVAHRFKPGQSGNPKGRPRKRPITERYAESLEMPLPDNLRKQLGLKAGATWGDAVAIGTIRAAVKGNHGASKELREAVEGKSTQRVELTAEGGGPVKISLIDTVARIKEIYGLGSDNNPEAEAADRTVSVSATVDSGSKPEKDRAQK